MCRIFSEWYVDTSIPWEFHLCIQATDWIVPEREEVWELLCLLWCFPSRTKLSLVASKSSRAAVLWQVANTWVPQSRSSFGVWHCSPTLGVLAIVIRWYALQSFLFLPVLSLTYLYTSQVWLSIRNDGWWSSRSSSRWLENQEVFTILTFAEFRKFSRSSFPILLQWSEMLLREESSTPTVW